MQWALFIPNLHQFHHLDDPWQSKDLTLGEKAYQKLQQEFGEIDFNRIYFGQEFCERAMPGIREIKEALARSREKKFTLVTPYVTEKGLSKLVDIFYYLVKCKPTSEVVVNDWGVLHLIRQKFPSLKPVFGRLLNKMLRDPRLKPCSPSKTSNTKFKHFQTCSLAGSLMKDLLSKYNVEIIEIDNLPQGIDNNIASWGYQVAMYIPYGYVTTGRICFFQSWDFKLKDKFRTNSNSCQHLCRSNYLHLNTINDLISINHSWDLIQRGNTVFYKQKPAFLTSGLSNAKNLGINRIIYQPEPF